MGRSSRCTDQSASYKSPHSTCRMRPPGECYAVSAVGKGCNSPTNQSSNGSSRVLVCSGIGSIDPAFWVIPLGASVLVGVITKICESKDTALRSLVVKMHKYFTEAFVMATVCPPYNALGIITSIPYVLGGLIFLLRMPENWINIATFLCSIAGQVAWVAVGYFVR
ncbi:hypothetical protein SK128_021345 [Halocaridina rubra]|uniref:Uncharacterized protein n=1 Tax=Halocaridina rubra TaxID=373956 RepID=A0AAN8ZVR6_HALRR